MFEQSFTALPTMKNLFDYIHKYPQRTQGLLGIDYTQLLQLLEQAQLKYAEQQAERERQKIRVNAKGGGRKPLLSVEEQVCLFYLRHYPTFEVLGLQFGVSKTEANETVHQWLRILRVLLPASLLEQVEANHSDYALVQDWLIFRARSARKIRLVKGF